MVPAASAAAAPEGKNVAGPAKPSLLSRIGAPWPFLAGVAFAFLACCAGGRLLSVVNCYKDFVRFHFYLNIQTLYYPTASQARSLVLARSERDRTLVLVGSNSVLWGMGQRAEEVWTRRLQEELGDEYDVVNLGMPGAYPWEFGGTTAEIVARDRPKCIFIAYPAPVPGQEWPQDGLAYRYFFWDAYYKGLLPLDAAREARLRQLDAERLKDNDFAELKLGRRLDAAVCFQDLWTVEAYECGATAWDRYTSRNFWRPRKRYADPDPGPLPLDRRYPPNEDGPRTEYIRLVALARPS